MASEATDEGGVITLTANSQLDQAMPNAELFEFRFVPALQAQWLHSGSSATFEKHCTGLDLVLLAACVQQAKLWSS